MQHDGPLNLSWGVENKHLKWQKKKCSLILHVRKIWVCERFRMGLRWCDNHEHLMNKSSTQVKQCTWFNVNGINFRSWMYLGFVILTWLEFGKRPPPSFLYYILQLLVKTTLKWRKCPRFSNGGLNFFELWAFPNFTSS
jgi:hypothetical protein